MLVNFGREKKRNPLKDDQDHAHFELSKSERYCFILKIKTRQIRLCEKKESKHLNILYGVMHLLKLDMMINPFYLCKMIYAENLYWLSSTNKSSH